MLTYFYQGFCTASLTYDKMGLMSMMTTTTMMMMMWEGGGDGWWLSLPRRWYFHRR